MSRWNRPMRQFRPVVPKCAVCGKPFTGALVYDSVRKAYVHAYDCTAPARRRPKVAP
jgi:hypothetical protein